VKIPDTYVLNKFYAYSGEPEYKKYDNTYNAGCPICREGKSWGNKKRLYYYPQSNTFYCFNCSRSWSALNWLCDACNLTPDEIYAEIEDTNFSLDISKKIDFLKPNKKKDIPSLPYDSINLFDKTQKSFYENKNVFFKNAYDYLESRKLDKAINKPTSLYLSLTDFHHKNRLCIPFQDRNKKIIFYQTRSLDKSSPKYLGKYGADKSLFGIDRIDVDLEYIFIFEGPIDAMFVKNGIAAAGLSLNNLQKHQLTEFSFHKKIWVVDNPKFDNAAKTNVEKLISAGESVFIWPIDMPYKDFNDYAVAKSYDEIDYRIITNNCLRLSS
jgi:hypothetical protein